MLVLYIQGLQNLIQSLPSGTLSKYKTIFTIPTGDDYQRRAGGNRTNYSFKANYSLEFILFQVM